MLQSKLQIEEIKGRCGGINFVLGKERVDVGLNHEGADGENYKWTDSRMT